MVVGCRGTHSGSREGEREGGLRRSTTGQDRTGHKPGRKRRDLKPRQSVDSVLAWAVQAWAWQQQKKRVRLGSAQLQAGGREGAPKCPVHRGVEWAGLHMVDAWAGGFDAGGLMWTRWALPCCPPPPGALVVEVPAVYRCCPLHTWAHTPGHPQGWDVSTDLSVWQPGQGCSSRPAVAWVR